MKQTTSANYALILVALAWPLALYGSLSQMGDYHPDVPQARITAARLISTVMLIAGWAGLLTTVGLAAYAYTAARVRALIALGAVIGPFVLVFVWALFP